MTLMKLKPDMPFKDLSHRFNVSLPTVSWIFTAWMVAMDVRLSPYIKWPDREDLWRTMPQCFQFSFGKKTTVIIDCMGAREKGVSARWPNVELPTYESARELRMYFMVPGNIHTPP